jgi:large subunit ribosomal protein L13
LLGPPEIYTYGVESTMRTTVADTRSIVRKWYVIDAGEMVLGRLASRVASVLIGKGKPAYSPNQDHGDNVIVVNASNVRLTGKKAVQKTYFRHSRYPSGDKTRTLGEQRKLDATQVVIHAVRGMVPKNARGRAIMRKLHVYAGAGHPHEAQKPDRLSPC